MKSVAINLYEHTIIRTVIIGIVVMQLIIVMFTLMIGSGFNSTCSGFDNQINPSCQLNNHIKSINSSVTGLANSLNCVSGSAGNPNCAIQAPNWIQGDPVNNIEVVLAGFANLITGGVQAIIYIILVAIALFVLISFVMILYIPGILSISGLGGLGLIIKIIFGGVDIILAVYLIILIAERLPWFKRH